MRTLIRDVSIFDGETLRSGNNAVVVSGDRIEAIADAASAFNEQAFDRVIEGKGMTLMPGMVESIAKLAKKSISPENEKIFASRFSNDLQKVIDEGKLSERQLARLNLIKEDLARSKFAETAGKGVGSDTVQKLAYSNMMQTAGIPTALTGSATSGVLGNVASRTGDVLYGRANREMAQKLAEALMSPEDTLRLMRVGRPVNTAIDAKTRNDLARLLTIQGLQKSGEAISGEQ